MGAGMARKAQRARASASHAKIRRWGACDTAALGCDTAGGLGHDTARPAHDTARRARSWARQCAPRNACWAQLGARASDLVFRTGFRLGDIFESPFGPGS